METKVYDIEGKEKGSAKLNAEVFGLEQPNEHAIYQAIRLIRANRRQGTHQVKERSDVAGSNKKPWRQKGTGGARAGSKQSPLWRHGGTVHGPRPRNYGFKLNKKVKRLARNSALTLKAQDEKVKVVDQLALGEAKTKAFKNMLNGLELADTKTLFVTSTYDKGFFYAGQNLDKVYITHVDQLNTYDILNADTLVVSQDALETINTRFA